MTAKKRLTTIGKVRTLVVIYGKRNVAVPVGTEFAAYEDKYCDWGYLLKFPKRKTLVGFYRKEWFEKVENPEDV